VLGTVCLFVPAIYAGAGLSHPVALAVTRQSPRGHASRETRAAIRCAPRTLSEVARPIGPAPMTTTLLVRVSHRAAQKSRTTCE
jgi:hypothetical protein